MTEPKKDGQNVISLLSDSECSLKQALLRYAEEVEILTSKNELLQKEKDEAIESFRSKNDELVEHLVDAMARVSSLGEEVISKQERMIEIETALRENDSEIVVLEARAIAYEKERLDRTKELEEIINLNKQISKENQDCRAAMVAMSKKVNEISRVLADELSHEIKILKEAEAFMDLAKNAESKYLVVSKSPMGRLTLFFFKVYNKMSH